MSFYSSQTSDMSHVSSRRNANTCVVPLVKMSYHAAFGIGLRASTPLLDIVNYLGLLVTAAYTAACVHGAMQQ